jgi:Cd2+/Zn2+-exporting ATPase
VIVKKIQLFLTSHRTALVIILTVLIALAELLHWLLPVSLPSELLMLVAGIIGVLPIALTAISSLQMKLVSIDVLVSLAVIGAFIIREFDEAAIVTWLFLLGDVLENLTLTKTRSAVKELTQMAPQTALVVTKDGKTKEVDVDLVDEGAIVQVKTGSQVPVDGVVIGGEGLVNESTITGESQPTQKKIGGKVYAGTLLENGLVTVRTTAVSEDTTFGKIIELVEESQDSKMKAQRFLDRFSTYYTPFVLVAALLVGLISRNLRLAITIMVLGCPGALVIGVPVSTVAGIGNGARRGILFKGSDVMDRLRRVDTIAFDKTGTLTVGHPQVEEIHVLRGQRQDILDHLVAIEHQSNHPLATAITSLPTVTNPLVTGLDVLNGQGLEATIEGQTYLVGNRRLIASFPKVLSRAGQSQEDRERLDHLVEEMAGRGNSIVIFARADGEELAVLGIRDLLRPDAAQALKELKKQGVRRLVMLTGDTKQTAKQIASELPIDEVKSGLLPQDKAAYIEAQKQAGHRIAFVGDGINDSIALSKADVAIAMGSGTDVALDVSDVVLVRSNLLNLSNALHLAKRTVMTMWENIGIALLTVLLLFIGLFAGYIEMASGMLIHELSILIVIFNAMRLLVIRGRKKESQSEN